MSARQPVEEIEAHYSVADPWNYEGNVDDDRRKSELLSVLPNKPFQRVLDIGCGDGFITFALPGEQILGVDISARAIEFARLRNASQPDPSRIAFECLSLFDLSAKKLGQFDLIIITGVLYSQYIAKGAANVRLIIDDLLEPGGILASCHIAAWQPVRFAYDPLDEIHYPYRDFTHVLEVLKKCS
ncbi:class I SAM-dependent methyltransferase [Aureimonas glaciei]|jgi:2-polyprenyl-3-methyl-5-hydroxy-6-metoxy-1,4-benzoquinol methylase|uniref:Methyltransferase domain-containing protein n=1 Tax=Aureimonas glaciei TaxID=1776957 RepID=A0A916XVH6_9HYPH|nr:class I SAM-dependent methyltransferase [Aureimonas glaciei]GGD14228.1 hypothetical protein GCM10011335_16270 [Aureimonas glaciei]